MDSSVSPKDKIWFLRVNHDISNAVYIFFAKFPSRSVGSVRILFSAPPSPLFPVPVFSLRLKPIFFFIQINVQKFVLYAFCIDLALQAGRTEFDVQAVQMCGGIGV